MKRTLLVALSAGTLLALAGCEMGAGGGVTPSPTASAEASDTPAPTVTPTPSEAPAETPKPTPPTEPVEQPLTASGAYDRCVELAGGFAYPGRPFTAAGFESAEVVARADGLWYIYVEVTIEDAGTPAERDVAFECILGGTLEHPRDELYGATLRIPSSSRDPNQPLPQG